MFDYEQSFARVDEYGQTYIEYYPPRYINTIGTAKPTINGTWVNYGSASSTESSERCPVESINGEILNSGSVANNNVSCEPHAYNAGNYYNFPAASANMSDPTTRSICSKGWRLPENNSNTSYSNLLISYGIDFNAGDNRIQPYDAALLNLPLSFLRSGYYYDTGDLSYQGGYGHYRISSLRLYFSSSSLNPTGGTYDDFGYPVRCVSR